MNNNTQYHDDERLIKEFLSTHTLEPRRNEWFTKRTLNKLPEPRSSSCKIIMCITTLLSVVACGVLLYLLPNDIVRLEENNITVSLLSIYTAMAGMIILVALQVIRLIKTYF
jgi:hypothetical protein